MAAALNQIKTDKARITEGVDSRPLVPNANGMTPLMHAVCDDSLDAVRGLLDSDADINAKREDGFTALALAAFFGRTAIVKVLLEKGADVRAMTRFGTSPLMWATARGFPKIVNLLRDAAKRRVQAPETHPTGVQKRPLSGSNPILPRTLPKITDPVPVTTPAFNPTQVFIARIAADGRSLATLVTAVIVILSLGIFAAYQIPQTLKGEPAQDAASAGNSGKTSVQPERSPEVGQDVDKIDEPAGTVDSGISTATTERVNPTVVKSSLRTFSASTPSRPSTPVDKPDSDEPPQEQVERADSASEFKPAPLTVEAPRQRVTARESPANTMDTSQTHPAPLGITSDKPKAKVIQWP